MADLDHRHLVDTWSRAARGAIARPSLWLLEDITAAWNEDRAIRGLPALTLDQALKQILEVVRDDVRAGKAT